MTRPSCAENLRTAMCEIRQSECAILHDDANRCEEQAGEEVAIEIAKSTHSLT